MTVTTPIKKAYMDVIYALVNKTAQQFNIPVIWAYQNNIIKSRPYVSLSIIAAPKQIAAVTKIVQGINVRHNYYYRFFASVRLFFDDALDTVNPFLHSVSEFKSLLYFNFNTEAANLLLKSVMLSYMGPAGSYQGHSEENEKHSMKYYAINTTNLLFNYGEEFTEFTDAFEHVTIHKEIKK